MQSAGNNGRSAGSTSLDVLDLDDPGRFGKLKQKSAIVPITSSGQFSRYHCQIRI